MLCPWRLRSCPWRWRSRSPIIDRVLAHTVMHIWCEYGECSLKSFWSYHANKVLQPWRSRSWPWRWRPRPPMMNRFLAHTMMHIWCEYGECSLSGSWIIVLTRCYNLKGRGHDLTVMHIWCEYGECSLNHSGVIMLTRCYNLGGQGYDLEDEGQGHP